MPPNLRIAILASAVLFFAVRGDASEWPQAQRMADFILSLQNEAGAIRDEPGVNTVNEDSNMEYALIALGAAFEDTHQPKYRTGLEKGIAWLAAREEMSDPVWKGSWYYVYSAHAPYAHIVTSPGEGKTDARGVDATSALFPYLLYLHQRVTGDNRLARMYSANARAALAFVMRHNLDKDGFSWSSYQLSGADGKWHLWEMKYSADQGDVYLGMHAAELLYRDGNYGRIARFLKTQTPRRFFFAAEQRYGMGIDRSGQINTATDGSSEEFSQGYLSWMWGDIAQDRAALQWLRSKLRNDGSVVSVSGKPAFSLNVAMLGLADSALAQPAPRQSFQWLLQNAWDARSGGVRHSSSRDSHEFANETAFCVISLLGFLPFRE